MVINVSRQQVIYVWHRYLHLFEGSNYFYNITHTNLDIHQNFQQDAKILNHFIKTIKMVLSKPPHSRPLEFFTVNNSLKINTLNYQYKKQKQKFIIQSRSVNLHTSKKQDKDMVPFKTFYESQAQEEKIFQSYAHDDIQSGTVLLDIFGKFLFPNASYLKVRTFQKVTIKSLRALAEIFTQSRGPYNQSALKKFIFLLVESLQVQNSLKVVKIVNKVLRSFLPFQIYLLQPTASALLKEYVNVSRCQ